MMNTLVTRRTLLTAALLIPALALAEPTRQAPWFSLESSSGATRTLKSYRGRVVLLMYEDRDSGGVNAALKAEVARRFKAESLATKVVVVPVADVHRYNSWPARKIVRAKVAEKAKVLGAEILLDWTGDIARAYGFSSPGSNVVLIGRSGNLLYKKSGPLDEAERARFHQILSGALGTRALANAAARKE